MRYVIDQIDLAAPIIPEHGLGGLDIGTNIFALRQRTLEDRDYRIKIRYLDYPTIFYKEVVEVIFNPYVGKISKLRAKKGYSGRLWNTITIGTRAGELQEAATTNGFTFGEYEDNGFFFFKDHHRLFAAVLANPDSCPKELNPNTAEGWKNIQEAPIVEITIWNDLYEHGMGIEEYPEHWDQKTPFQFGL